MFARTIADQFAAETDPEVISVMLADFGLEVIKRFGPEYFAERDLIEAASGTGNRRN